MSHKFSDQERRESTPYVGGNPCQVCNGAAVSFASGADFDTFPTHGIDGSDPHCCYESPTQDNSLTQVNRPRSRRQLQ